MSAAGSNSLADLAARIIEHQAASDKLSEALAMPWRLAIS